MTRSLAKSCDDGHSLLPSVVTTKLRTFWQTFHFDAIPTLFNLVQVFPVVM